jgi:type IV pilus assembly protein PilY1
MKHNKPIWTLLAMLVASQGAPVAAAQFDLAQLPAGSATEPAPNVIVSVDDSGSMGWDINGCMTPDWNIGVYGDRNEAGSANCPSRLTNPNPSRMASLRTALINTFGNPATGATGILPDGRIRLAWQAMWDNGASTRPSGQQNNQSTLTAGAVNAIQPFTGTHRSHFNNFINSLRPVYGTPSIRVMSNVNAYMSTTGTNSPFATAPGTSGSPQLSCRKTFHVFMTDGAWNSETEAGTGSIGNSDGTARTTPSGVTINGTAIPGQAYDIASNQTRIYRDSWGGARGTMGDWAFANWATDFQTGLTNNARQIMPEDENETVGATSLQPYWNPKNNPMTWQGVTQHTIGYGNSATRWIGAPLWSTATDNTYGGDYANLVNGTVGWIDLYNPLLAQADLEVRRASDLWHAAINGRGKFYPARTPAALTQAFQDILDTILAQTSNPLVSVVNSSSRLRTDGLQYVASYNSEKKWSGDLLAYGINATTRAVASVPTWQAATLMDAATFSTSNRVVLTHNDTEGRFFLWNELSNAQRSLLRANTTDTEAVGQKRLDYLRGVRTDEVGQTNGILRTRESRLGDIVNSDIWLTGQPFRLVRDYDQHKEFRDKILALNSGNGRRSMLYVGANDGMLHGFDATTGQEVLAYVPRGVYSNLREYTTTNYTHKYFVDGNPFTADVDLSNGATPSEDTWATVLVSGLGAGGRGYFVLNVTDPSNMPVSSVMVDNTFRRNATVATATAAELAIPNYRDIGHIFSAPVVDTRTGARVEQVVKLNNNRWALILGNGPNSINERPALLLQYLDGTRGMVRLLADSTMGQGNGLSAPRPVDINSDGTTDVVYAGDLRGNLWKFDLSSTTASNWGVSGWNLSSTCRPTNATPMSCTPLHVAIDADGNRQPITVAPLWMANPLGGLQLLYGTGQLLTEADRSNTAQQTVYSVWDKTSYTSTQDLTADPIETSVRPNATNSSSGPIALANGRTSLVQQEVTTQAGSTRYFNSSENEVDYTSPTAPKRGWYMDLPLSRERTLKYPMVFEGQKVIVFSELPKLGTSGETCEANTSQEDNWVNVLNMFTGKPSQTPVWPAADDSRDKASRTNLGSGDFTVQRDRDGRVEIQSIGAIDGEGPGRITPPPLKFSGAPTEGSRTDWREVR